MRLPDIRKILREDIKTKEAWVLNLIDPINSFMDIIYIALNKNITFQENIRSIVKEVTVVTPSTYPSDFSSIKFQNTLKIKATGLLIVQAYEKDTYTPIVTQNPAWVENNGTLTISSISGLSASKTYLFRFLVF